MKKSSIKKNFAYQMIYEILILILPFITSPYISRVVGAEGLGNYSYSYSVAYFFVLFSMLGIKNYGNRAVAQVRNDDDKLNTVFSNLCMVHIFFSVVCLLVYIGYVFSIKDGQMFAILQLFYVASALLDISWFYFGIEQFKLTVIRNVVIRLFNVIAIFVFVRNPLDMWKYCLIMSFSNFLSQLVLWMPLKKYVRFVKPSWMEMKIHIKPIFVLFVPAIAVSLYKYMDKIMVGALSDKIQLGFYDNADKVINIPSTIIGAFGTVMLPKMSNLIANDDYQSVKRYVSLSIELVMCLSMALAFGLASVASVFAPVFWGAEFSYSGLLIGVLSITIPFVSFANVIRTQYLIPREKDREYMSSVIIGAVINLIINALLIPSMGAIGASIGTVVSEITVCFIQSFVVRNELTISKYIKSFLPFVLIGGAMYIVVYNIGQLLEPNIMTLIVQIIMGGIMYSLLSLVVFVKEKNQIILNLLYKIKKGL